MSIQYPRINKMSDGFIYLFFDNFLHIECLVSKRQYEEGIVVSEFQNQ